MEITYVNLNHIKILQASCYSWHNLEFTVTFSLFCLFDWKSGDVFIYYKTKVSLSKNWTRLRGFAHLVGIRSAICSGLNEQRFSIIAYLLLTDLRPTFYSQRNQSIGMLWKSVNWFLHELKNIKKVWSLSFTNTLQNISNRKQSPGAWFLATKVLVPKN